MEKATITTVLDVGGWTVDQRHQGCANTAHGASPSRDSPQFSWRRRPEVPCALKA